MSTKKGKKRVKNIPVLHDEPKNKRGVWLTDTAWHSIQELAVKEGVSKERVFRRIG
ncbi:hypothetical protein [Tolypothrix sp. VBCCA 56010]|uniref:hypothetical protein n=1 Tax=Tolypothrix sp. VBCCA 56010 TaxID=3137731 RepID=UPI003D7DBAF5